MWASSRLRIHQMLAMRPLLRRFYGRSWPLALVRGLLGARGLVRRTRWAGRRDPEAAFVRGLALLPAVALDLRARLGGPATEAIRELAEAVLDAEHEYSARKAGLAAIEDPRERWHAFFDRAVPHGIHAFDENDCLSLEQDRLHIRVFRCVLAELAREAAVPELVRAGCERNAAFYRSLLPSHELSQSEPLRATLACGQPYCDYVWQRRPQQLPEDAAARPAEDRAPAPGETAGEAI